MLTFRIRCEETNSRYDDQTLARKFKHLNGRVIQAADTADADRQLAALGLSIEHGLGLTNALSHWAYPTAEDEGFKVWYLSADRRRIGNNAKLQQLRNPK